MKNLFFLQVRSTSENADIFTIFGICRKKVNFLFILYSTEIQKAQSNFFNFPRLFLFRFDLFSVFIGYNFGCLHLGNGLETYFYE